MFQYPLNLKLTFLSMKLEIRNLHISKFIVDSSWDTEALRSEYFWQKFYYRIMNLGLINPDLNNNCVWLLNSKAIKFIL